MLARIVASTEESPAATLVVISPKLSVLMQNGRFAEKICYRLRKTLLFLTISMNSNICSSVIPQVNDTLSDFKEEIHNFVIIFV